MKGANVQEPGEPRPKDAAAPDAQDAEARRPRGRASLVGSLVGALLGAGCVWAGSHGEATWSGYAAGAAVGATVGWLLGPRLVTWLLEALDLFT